MQSSLHYRMVNDRLTVMKNLFEAKNNLINDEI